jgi:hypothetical protein
MNTGQADHPVKMETNRVSFPLAVVRKPLLGCATFSGGPFQNISAGFAVFFEALLAAVPPTNVDIDESVTHVDSVITTVSAPSSKEPTSDQDSSLELPQLQVDNATPAGIVEDVSNQTTATDEIAITTDHTSEDAKPTNASVAVEVALLTEATPTSGIPESPINHLSIPEISTLSAETAALQDVSEDISLSVDFTPNLQFVAAECTPMPAEAFTDQKVADFSTEQPFVVESAELLITPCSEDTSSVTQDGITPEEVAPSDEASTTVVSELRIAKPDPVITTATQPDESVTTDVSEPVSVTAPGPELEPITEPQSTHITEPPSTLITEPEPALIKEPESTLITEPESTIIAIESAIIVTESASTTSDILVTEDSPAVAEPTVTIEDISDNAAESPFKTPASVETLFAEETSGFHTAQATDIAGPDVADELVTTVSQGSSICDINPDLDHLEHDSEDELSSEIATPAENDLDQNPEPAPVTTPVPVTVYPLLFEDDFDAAASSIPNSELELLFDTDISWSIPQIVEKEKSERDVVRERLANKATAKFNIQNLRLEKAAQALSINATAPVDTVTKTLSAADAIPSTPSTDEQPEVSTNNEDNTTEALEVFSDNEEAIVELAKDSPTSGHSRTASSSSAESKLSAAAVFDSAPCPDTPVTEYCMTPPKAQADDVGEGIRQQTTDMDVSNPVGMSDESNRPAADGLQDKDEPAK